MDVPDNKREFPIHTSWNEVKVELTLNGVILEFSFDKELEPFAVQFASEDFKDYFDICDGRLKFQGLNDNVLHMIIEEQVQHVKQAELRQELLELLHGLIDDIETFPIHDSDIPVLSQLYIKSDKAKCYTFKDNIYICGLKKYLKPLMKTLAKPTVPGKVNDEQTCNLEGKMPGNVEDEHPVNIDVADERTRICDARVFAFLKRHEQCILKQLEREHNVRMSLLNGKIMFRGTKDDTQRADHNINEILIAKSVILVKDTWKLLSSERGQEAMDKMTASHSCGWTITRENFDNEDNRKLQVLMSKSVNVSVEECSLLDIQVDCIVLIVHSNMHLKSSGVGARSLAEKAGNHLQELINSNHPEHLDEGRGFFQMLPKPLSSGIKAVILGYLSEWDRKDDMQLQTLKQFVLGCLRESGRNHYSTIGFPPIGTGVLKYPHRDVATTMFDAIDQYSTKDNGGHMESVTIAIFDKKDPSWDFMTKEKARRERTKKKLLAFNEESQYLESSMKHLDVMVKVKPYPDEALSSNYVIANFQLPESMMAINSDDSTKSEIFWNDHLNVKCRNTERGLSIVFKEVVRMCEQNKVTSVAVNCSPYFDFSETEQIDVIVKVLNKQKNYKYLSKVLLRTSDEKHFNVAADKLLSLKEAKPGSWLFTGSNVVWTKHEEGPPRENFVVFGFVEDEVDASIEELRGIETDRQETVVYRNTGQNKVHCGSNVVLTNHEDGPPRENFEVFGFVEDEVEATIEELWGIEKDRQEIGVCDLDTGSVNDDDKSGDDQIPSILPSNSSRHRFDPDCISVHDLGEELRFLIEESIGT